jgi:hypothetical protein
VAIVNPRIRVFLTVVSMIFAGLLAVQIVAVLLHPADQANPAANRQQVVDRPAADPAPAANPPKSPSGRGLIRHPAQWTAQAG